jgi:hypothetical protein
MKKRILGFTLVGMSLAILITLLSGNAMSEERVCAEHGFGCGSCVADGVWGVLWVHRDCSTSCQKQCGNEPAR